MIYWKKLSYFLLLVYATPLAIAQQGQTELPMFSAPKILEARVSDEEISGSGLFTSQRRISGSRGSLLSPLIARDLGKELEICDSVPLKARANLDLFKAVKRKAEEITSPIIKAAIELNAPIHASILDLDNVPVVHREISHIDQEPIVQHPFLHAQVVDRSLLIGPAIKRDSDIGASAMPPPHNELNPSIETLRRKPENLGKLAFLPSHLPSELPSNGRASQDSLPVELAPVVKKTHPDELIDEPIKVRYEEMQSPIQTRIDPLQPVDHKSELVNATIKRKPPDELLVGKQAVPEELALAAKRPAEDISTRVSGTMKNIVDELEAPLVLRKIEPLATALDSDSVEDTSWDRWFETFGRLGDASLVRTLTRYGNPAGSNSASITVLKDHQIKVTVLGKGDSAFDKATREAYEALAGNKGLEFPASSKRSQISFMVDNSHDSSGNVTEVQGSRLRNFKEDN